MTLNFPPYFADAEANFNTADFIIFGVPYDQTSSFRKGATQAPQAIRQASWNFETYDLRTGYELSTQHIHDYGDLKVEAIPVTKMVQQVQIFTNDLRAKKKIPIALGGEHSITAGIIQALPKNTAVIVCDAHLDYRKEYEGQAYNHACVNRRICDHVGIENLTILGVRSAEKQEMRDAQNHGVYYKDAFHIQTKGITTLVNEIQKRTEGKNIYLSIDSDVIDPCFAPGTSTPEPFGLTPFDILQVIETVAPHCIGFDITEVCPPYDQGQTALLTAKLIRLALNSIGRKSED